MQGMPKQKVFSPEQNLMYISSKVAIQAYSTYISRERGVQTYVMK